MHITSGKGKHGAHFYIKQRIFGFFWDWKLHCHNCILNSYIRGGLEMATNSFHHLLWSKEVYSPISWEWAGPGTCFAKETLVEVTLCDFHHWPQGVFQFVFSPSPARPAALWTWPGWFQWGPDTKCRGSACVGREIHHSRLQHWVPDSSDQVTLYPNWLQMHQTAWPLPHRAGKRPAKPTPRVHSESYPTEWWF